MRNILKAYSLKANLTVRICSFCNHGFPQGESRCPHCARPSLFPNVEKAEEDAERKALDARYIAARQDAESRGCLPNLEAFEAAVGRSKAVISRDFREAFRLLTQDNQAYATYYQLIRSGIRLVSGEKWDILRAVTDEAIFPNYKEHIRFAALWLSGPGLYNYGNCLLILRDAMIAHRTSVFEENSVMFMEHHNVKIASAHQLPEGYRSTWPERARLCVAKLHGSISAGTSHEQHAELLVKQGATSEDDAFVEVHIWGSVTRMTLEKVVIGRTAYVSKVDKVRLKALRVKGIEVEVQ